jgi:hypothetical protein
MYYGQLRWVECSYFTADEIKQAIPVIGRDLPDNTPIGIYGRIDASQNRLKLIKPDDTVKMGKGIITATVPISGIEPGTEYLVVAVTDTTKEPFSLREINGQDRFWLNPEATVFDCFYVPSEEPTPTAPGVPPHDTPPIGPRPSGSRRPTIDPGRIPPNQSPLPEVTGTLRSIGSLSPGQSPGDQVDVIVAAPAVTPPVVEASSQVAARESPGGGSGYSSLLILGLVAVVPIGGWLWVKRRRG